MKYIEIAGIIEIPDEAGIDCEKAFDKILEAVEAFKGSFGGGYCEVDEDGIPLNTEENEEKFPDEFYYEESGTINNDTPLTHVIYQRREESDSMFAWTYSKEEAEFITTKLNG